MASESRARRGPLSGSLLFALVGAIGLAGCRIPGQEVDHLASVPALSEQCTKEEVVARLNENIHELQGWRSDDLKIKLKQPGMIELPVSATIAVESPRNFRLRAKSLLRGDEADFGSNAEHFWYWIRDSPQHSIFMAKHENVHLVQQRMDIPFDTSWLMESLGVVPLDPTVVSLEQTDPSGRVVDLFEERILANGHRVKLATTVDTRHAIIVGRSLYDPSGGLVARATILDHRVHDPDGPTGGVVMPHTVKLEWPQVRTTLTLEIGRIDVNPTIPVALWTMPDIPGYRHVELGTEKRTASLPVERRPVVQGPVVHGLGASSPIDGPGGQFGQLDQPRGFDDFNPPTARPVSFESPQSTRLDDRGFRSQPLDSRRGFDGPGFGGADSGGEPMWQFEDER